MLMAFADFPILLISTLPRILGYGSVRWAGACSVRWGMVKFKMAMLGYCLVNCRLYYRRRRVKIVLHGQGAQISQWVISHHLAPKRESAGAVFQHFPLRGVGGPGIGIFSWLSYRSFFIFYYYRACKVQKAEIFNPNIAK